jgi:hypothetical protein
MLRMTKITVQISPSLKKELKALSRKQGVSMAAVVRDVLRRYLAIREFCRLRKVLVPLAQAQGIYTDEDVFKIVS